MIYRHRFREIVKPIIIGSSFLVILSSIFVISFVFYDYHNYLNNYYKKQNDEINSAKTKNKAIFEDLSKLMNLAAFRIQAANNNQTRLNTIMNSLHQFNLSQNITKLPFKKVTYTKLNSPRVLINRFGISESSTVLDKKLVESSIKNVVHYLDNHVLINQMGIKNNKTSHKTLQGILEIQIDEQDLINTLGDFQTISLSKSHQDENTNINMINDLIPIYVKNPLSFLLYFQTHYSHYEIFGAYVCLVILLLALYLTRTNKQIQKKYQDRYDNQNRQLENLTKSRDDLIYVLTKLEKNTKTRSLDCNAKKQLLSSLQERQKEQAIFLAEAIVIAMDTLKELAKNHQKVFAINDHAFIMDISSMGTNHRLSNSSKESDSSMKNSDVPVNLNKSDRKTNRVLTL